MKVLDKSIKTGELKKEIDEFEALAIISKGDTGYKLNFKVKNLSSKPEFIDIVAVGEIPITDRLFVNNFQSWGPCKLISKDTVPKCVPRNALLTRYPISPIPWELDAGITSDYFISTEEAFAGFLSSKTAHPYFSIQDKSIIVKLYIGKTLQPQEVVELEPLWWNTEGFLVENLKKYAQMVAQYNSVSIGKPLFGWASWYYYYLNISEEAILKEIELAKENKLEYELFQIDDGYESDIGDWLETNKKFPSGVEFIAKRIKQEGMIPGIWTAPFSISESSELFQQHPNWVVKDKNDKPIIAYKNWGKKIYALDTTNPNARSWLRDTLTTLKGYGYGFFKIDFLFAGMIPGKRYMDVSPVEAYRMGMKEIREALNDAHILGCGAPLLPSIGYVDSMRIGADTAPYWHEKHNGMPSAKYSMRNAITRNFMNSVWWRNDPDCVMARSIETELNEDERKLNIYLPALLNGLFLQSDRLSVLSKSNIATIRSAINFRGGETNVNFISEERFVLLSRQTINGYVLSFVNLSDRPWEIEIKKFTKQLSTGEEVFFIKYPSMQRIKEWKQSIKPHSILIILQGSKINLKREDKKKTDGREFHYYGSVTP